MPYVPIPRSTSPIQPSPSESLTPAQVEFARVLGNLFASLWEREHGHGDKMSRNDDATPEKRV